MRHLLDFQGWSRTEVESLLDTARVMREVLERPIKKVPALQGFTVATVFFEPSTRTRISFELAARRMSADVVSFAAQTSSLQKGESYKDTLLTLGPWGWTPTSSGPTAPAYPTRPPAGSRAPSSTGGRAPGPPHPGPPGRLHPPRGPGHPGGQEGRHRGGHPSLPGGPLGRRAPLPPRGPGLLRRPPEPPPQSLPGAHLTPRLEEALEEADAVMVLRLQKERMEAGLVHLEDYVARYQVTEKRLALAKPQAPSSTPAP